MAHDPNIALDEQSARDFDMFELLESDSRGKLFMVGNYNPSDALVALEVASLALEHAAYHVKASETGSDEAKGMYFLTSLTLLDALGLMYNIIERGNI